MGTGTGTRHRDCPREPVPPEQGTRGTVLAAFRQSPDPIRGSAARETTRTAPPLGTRPRCAPRPHPAGAGPWERSPHPPSPTPHPPLLLLLLLFPPVRRGTQASGPAPTHQRLRGVRRGRGSVGWDPRGGPAAASVSSALGMRWRGSERSRGGPASCSCRPSGGVRGCTRSPPNSCSAGCGTPGVYGPRSPLREPVRGTTTPRPREGHGRGRVRGAGENPHARIPLCRPAGPAPLRGAHAAARHCRGEGGRAAPPPCAKTPGQGSTPKPVPPGFARAPRRPQPP